MTPDKVTIGNTTLYCGDCREIVGELTFDSIVTDPPYGIGMNTMHPYKHSRNGKKRNLHSGGTWARKDIYKDIDWDSEAPDLTFLLEQNVPMIIFGGNYFAELPPSRKWIIWDKGETYYRRSFAEAELAWCSSDGNTRIIKYLPDFNRGFSINGSRIAKSSSHAKACCRHAVLYFGVAEGMRQYRVRPVYGKRNDGRGGYKIRSCLYRH